MLDYSYIVYCRERNITPIINCRMNCNYTVWLFDWIERDTHFVMHLPKHVYCRVSKPILILTYDVLLLSLAPFINPYVALSLDSLATAYPNLYRQTGKLTPRQLGCTWNLSRWGLDNKYCCMYVVLCIVIYLLYGHILLAISMVVHIGRDKQELNSSETRCN
jgi:hypothetical protein